MEAHKGARGGEREGRMSRENKPDEKSTNFHWDKAYADGLMDGADYVRALIEKEAQAP